MENWNPVGWLLLLGGFLFGVIVGWLQVGDKLWLGSYTAMLAGLTILLTNLIRTLWRVRRRRRLINSRLYS
jgi:cytochrome b561